MATVSALTYYPIKGCAGVTVEKADVARTGLAHDRLFAVIGTDEVYLWQGAVPRLATIRGQILHAGTKLALSAPGAGDLILNVEADGPVRPAKAVEKWSGGGIDQGDEAAGWFSEVLGMPVRLVQDPDRASRADRADPTALLVTSMSSLDGLNARILERGADPVPMNRFRPNIVITGWPEPHTEDRVGRMTIGTTEIGFGKLAIRCAVTTVDQLTGKKSGPEPLRTLAGYRREPEGGVSFGLKAAVLHPGELFVGDEVTVTEWL